MHMMPPSPGQAPIVPAQHQDLAEPLLEALQPARWPVPPAELPAGTAVVGGAVRDALLGRLARQPDLDLVVEGDAVALARRLAQRHGGSVVVLDAERSIARLVLRGWTLDLARRMGAWPEEDLLRRDFSANAIALELAGSSGAPRLLDPAGGLDDVAQGRLRALSERNLLDDPLRLLRGLRLAAELGFRIEPTTWEWIRRHHHRLGEVAAERVLAELERLAVAPSGGEGLGQVLEAHLLAAWQGERGPLLPEPRPLPLNTLRQLSPAAASQRGLSAAEAAVALPLARLAVLLDPSTLRALKASRRLQLQSGHLRRWWLRLQPGGNPEGLPEAERLQLQRELEEVLPALTLLAAPAWAAPALERWRDPHDPLFHPRPPLDGAVLQRTLDLAPGRQLGDLLAHLCQERAFGRLPRDPDGDDPQTLTAARAWLTGEEGSRHG
jgi:tRNA nucleotidyltransferase (CCA-adding enzyme)